MWADELALSELVQEYSWFAVLFLHFGLRQNDMACLVANLFIVA